MNYANFDHLFCQHPSQNETSINKHGRFFDQL